MINCLEEIIQNWCNEVNEPCSITRDYSNDTVTIYTKHPGIFIGPHGQTSDKYAKLLDKIKWKYQFKQITEAFTPGNDYRELQEENMKAFLNWKGCNQ